MNIIDVINSSSTNAITSKIAMKTQEKKMKARAEQYVNDILNFFKSESEYIDNGLTYCDNPLVKHEVISQEEKKQLQKKLIEIIRSIPDDLDELLKDIFDTSVEQKEDEQKEDEQKEDKEKAGEVETQTVSIIAKPELAQSPAETFFRY